MKILETERLMLRTWNDNDVQPMLAINQDPKVMEYFPGLQDLEMTKNFIDKVNAHFENHGYSLYTTVRKDTNEFIGFIGLLIADFKAHFTPATEIGWRLSSNHWGQGFATEGAKAVLDYAFRELKIPEIVSFTAAGNAKSIRVMQKIGLQHNEADDFDPPKLDDESPLKRHVLYRLSREKYTQGERS
jgi:RimJ/RimL family protein N-acetyltransferase